MINKKGGSFSAVWGAVVESWLPAQVAKINIGWDAKPFVTVDGIGQATLQLFTDDEGRPTTISGAKGQTAFGIESMNLASSKGSQWTDQGLRPWKGEDGVIYKFNWNS